MLRENSLPITTEIGQQFLIRAWIVFPEAERWIPGEVQGAPAMEETLNGLPEKLLHRLAFFLRKDAQVRILLRRKDGFQCARRHEMVLLLNQEYTSDF
jgi:hypothetical protein